MRKIICKGGCATKSPAASAEQTEKSPTGVISRGAYSSVWFYTSYEVIKELGDRLIAWREKSSRVLLIFDFCLALQGLFVGMPGFPLLFGFSVFVHIVVNNGIVFLSLDYRCHTLLREKGLTAIQKFSCKITQLSQFKNISKNMALVFRQNNYEEYAKALEQRALSVEENILAKQKYEERFVELDRDIAMIVGISSMGYEQCAANLSRMKGWEQFFNNITDMPNALLQEQKGKVSSVIKQLSKRMYDISANVATLVQTLSETSRRAQVVQLEEKLNAMLHAGLNEADTSTVKKCLREIAAARDLVDQICDHPDPDDTGGRHLPLPTAGEEPRPVSPLPEEQQRHGGAGVPAALKCLRQK